QDLEVRARRGGQVRGYLRQQRPHRHTGHNTDAFPPPGFILERTVRVLNSRLEVAYRAHAVLALLEVPVPLRRRQRNIGLEVEIVGAVTPWCTAVPHRAGREVVHRRQRGAAFVAGRLSHQRVLAELSERDGDRRYGQNGRSETVQIAQRAHQLSPV